MGLQESIGRKKVVLPQDLWTPQGIEEDREEKPLHVFCYKAEHTGELELEDRKEKGDPLPDSLACVSNRSNVLVLSLRDGMNKENYIRKSG